MINIMQSSEEVCVELGAGDFSAFKNSTPYAIEKINKITADLLSKGILKYGDEFALSVSEGIITIGTGIAVFPDGKKFELTETYSIEVQTGELYIENTENLNTIVIKIGTLPETNDYIHLATINEYGALSDNRFYAKSSVVISEEDLSYVYSLDVPATTSSELFEFSFDLKTNGINKILIISEDNFPFPFILYDVKTNEFIGLSGHSNVGIENSKALTSTFIRIGTAGAISDDICMIEVSETTDDITQFRYYKRSSGNTLAKTVKFYAFGGNTE